MRMDSENPVSRAPAPGTPAAGSGHPPEPTVTPARRVRPGLAPRLAARIAGMWRAGRTGHGPFPLLGLGLLVLGIRGAFVVGLVGSDDTRYIEAAWKLAAGLPAGVSDHAYVRAAFVGWLALWVKAGLLPSQLWIAQLATEVLLSLAIVRFASQFVSRWSALLAALCWALHPIGLVYGGIILPDLFGLTLALVGTTQCIRMFGSGHVRPAAVVLAGVPLGLAVSAKEPFALVLPIIGAWALWRSPDRPRDLRVMLGIGVVSVAAFALEYPFFRLWTGDWLYHHHALTAQYGVAGAQSGPGGAAVHGKPFYYLTDVLLEQGVTGPWGAIGLLSIVVPNRAVRDHLFLVLWTAIFLVYLQYGTSDLTHYNPVPRQPRYLEPVCLALAVTTAALGEAVARRGRAAWGLAAAGMLWCSTSSVGVARQRLRDEIYLANIPRSVAAAAVHARDEAPLLVPTWAFRRIPPDWRAWGTPTHPAALCALLGRAPEAPGQLSARIVVLPDRPARPEGCRIEHGWAVEELRAPITPLDRLLADSGLDPLHHLANMRRVGTLARAATPGDTARGAPPPSGAR